MSVSDSSNNLFLLVRNNINDSSSSVNDFNQVYLNFDVVRRIFSYLKLEDSKASLIVNKSWKKIISNAIGCNIFFIQLEIKNVFNSSTADFDLSSVLVNIEKEKNLEDITIRKIKIIHSDFVKIMTNELRKVVVQKDWRELKTKALNTTNFSFEQSKDEINRVILFAETIIRREKALERDADYAIKDSVLLAGVVKALLVSGEIDKAAETYREAYGWQHDWIIFQNTIFNALSSTAYPDFDLLEGMATEISNQFVQYQVLLKIDEAAKKHGRVDSQERIQSYFEQIYRNLIRDNQSSYVENDDKYLNQAKIVAESILDPIVKKACLDQISKLKGQMFKSKIADFFTSLRFW